MWKILVLVLPLFSFLPSSSSMEVYFSFSEIRKTEGNLLLSVCRNEMEFPYEPFRSITIPKSSLMEGKQLHYRFELPPGIYAIAVLDDENRNGEMDSNWLGIPKEGFAFSNNIKAGLTGPPSFEDCRLKINKNQFRHDLVLTYWVGE